MCTKKTQWTRGIAVAVSAVLLAIGVAGAASAQLTSANPLDEINKLGGSSSSPNLTQGTAPVVKLAAAGRVNEVLSSGGCLNNPLTATCGSSCDNITLNGTVSVTGLGKSTLNACYTIELSTVGVCYTGLGIGTLTNKGGNSINISFGGPFCVNDENVSTSTIFFSTTGTYIIEGGTGPFANETGAGSFNVSDIFNGGSVPLPGIGQISMNGTMSKN